MKYLFLATFLLIGLTTMAAAQSDTDPVRLYVATVEPPFKVKTGARVKVTFENRTGETIRSVNLLSIGLILESLTVAEDRCHWNDCYIAFFSPRSKEELPDGGFFEVEVDLADLYWADMIDSQRDSSRPKNLFKKVMTGGYTLKAQLHHSLDLWAKDDPRFEEIIESDKCIVTIETEKPYRKYVWSEALSRDRVPHRAAPDNRTHPTADTTPFILPHTLGAAGDARRYTAAR